MIDREKFENEYNLEDYGVILSEQSDQLIVDKLNWKGEAKKSGMQMGDIISNFKIENPDRPNKAIVYPFSFLLFGRAQIASHLRQHAFLVLNFVHQSN